MRKHTANERGTNLIELALLLPVLLLILGGVFDLGRGFNAYIALQNAAREAAVYGSTNPTDSSGIVSVARAEADRNGLDNNRLSVAVQGFTRGEPITVTLEYRFQLFTFVLATPEMTLRTTAQMVVF